MVADRPLLMAIEQGDLEASLAHQLAPRLVVREAVRIQIAIATCAALMDVDERQPFLVWPEAPQDVAAEVVRIEQAALQLRSLKEVARGTRIARVDEADADRISAVGPASEAHEHDRSGNECCRSEERR